MSENKNAKTPTDDGHVAHVYLFEKTGRPMVAWDNAKDIKLGDRLYVAPKREWVGLKDEQVEDEWERITGHSIFGGDRSEGRAMFISPDEVIEFSRAIESKLKEKNGGEYRNGATTERTKLKEKNA
jgi:hypothetical protein